MASPSKGKKISSNNQEEKEKHDNSDYGTEDFDNESVGSSKKIAESEDEYYPKDNSVTDGDDQTGIRSMSTTTTERDSCSQVGPVTSTQPISTRQEVEVRSTELDSKFSSYDDDFADYDSIGELPQPEAPTGFDGANSSIKHWGNEPPPDQSLMGKPTDGSDSYASDMDLFESDHDVGDDEGRMVDDALSASQMPEGSKVTRDNDGIRVNADDAVLDQRFGDTTPSFDSSLVEDPRGKQPVAMEGETMGRRITEEKATADDGDGCGTDKELEMLKRQVDAARAVLISSLGGDDDNGEKSLLELVLLAQSRSCKAIAENNKTTNRATAKAELSAKKASKAAAAAAAAVSLRVESAARAELEKRVESLERDLSRASKESRMQSRRAVSLQRRLDIIEAGHDDAIDGRLTTIVDDYNNGPEAVVTADIVALKHKVVQLVERLRQEKYARLKSEHEAQKTRQKPKVQMLSDHIEKLMVFLKHEATQRAKAHEQQRRLQKELGLVKARNSALMRSNQAKDRATVELREGSKILEDQLRLMDEKYMELRTKLDWTRTKAEKDVRKARAQASALRSKWALLCGGGRMGACPLLDSAKADVGAPLRKSASVPETTSKEGRGAVSDGVYGFFEEARKSKQQKQQQHRDYRVQFNGVPSQSGGDRGYSSPITDGNRKPESAENGRFHGKRREKTVGMAPSMSAPSLFSKHQNPHGQQQRYTAPSGGFGGVGAGEKVKGEGYTQQQFRALSNSIRAEGSNYPDTRVAAGCPGGGEKSSGGGVSGSAAGHRLPLGEGGERDGGGGGGGRGASELLYA